LVAGVEVEAAAGAVEAVKVAVACWEHNSLYPSTPVHAEITLTLDFPPSWREKVRVGVIRLTATH
jgi:hypothetical protein